MSTPVRSAGLPPAPHLFEGSTERLQQSAECAHEQAAVPSHMGFQNSTDKLQEDSAIPETEQQAAAGPGDAETQQVTRPTLADVLQPKGGAVLQSIEVRFDRADVSGWQTHLNEEGYAVVSGALGPGAVAETVDQIWSSIETAFEGVKQHDSATWKAWRLDGRGFITSAIAQGQGAWSVRGNPDIKQVFAHIWQTDELLVSMDAMIMWKPWWQNPDWLPKTEGLHLDQNPFNKPDLCCVQGMLVLEDILQEVGGLQVVPQSHLPEAKARLMRKRPVLKHAGDWCVLGDPSPSQPQPRLVMAKAGDLILWDSRTVHGGVVGAGLAADSEAQRLPRLAVPVCMTPRAWATQEALEERLQAFDEGSVLSHWPHETAGTGGHKVGSIVFRPIELTSEQRALL